MEDFRMWIGITAGALALADYFFYYISIVRGQTRPSSTTWIILTIVGVLIAASYKESGAGNTLWFALAYVAGPLIIALLSIKYGYAKWTKVDFFCLGMAGISVVIWWLSKDPLLVLLINIFIDFIGLLPTMIKSYRDPLSEAVFPWFITVFASALNLLAIEAWMFSIAVYPVYMIIANGLIFYFLVSQRKKLIL